MLEIVVAFLGVGCLALLGVSGWLFALRGRLMADAARSEAEKRGMEDDLTRASVRAQEAEARLEDATRRGRVSEIEAAELKERLRSAEEKLELEQRALREQHAEVRRALEKQLADADVKFSATFRALAGQVLGDTRAELTKIAEEKFKGQATIAAQDMEQRKQAVERLLQPIAETLKKTDEKLAAIEKERQVSYAALNEQVRAMGETGNLLRAETGKLVRALREPHVRGRYGEIQLKRVAELAGMTEYCDFSTQDQTTDVEGRALKPDMVVRMPSDRVVVVDAKTNIQAYLDAMQAEGPEAQEACLDRFARHVSEQARALAGKRYWAQYEGSPEFVVMFIPGDQFIDAALSRKPEILEEAARQNVLLASPSTLIGLLRAVAVGYHEQKLAKAAEELRELGKQLHERARAAFEHVRSLGGAIENAVKHYNNFVGSYQTRLEPTLRKFEESGVRGKEDLPVVEVVSTQLRLTGTDSGVERF